MMVKSVKLKDWIFNNPDLLGDKVVQKWGFDLPFWFKVLSVGKALSIQAQPDKELARMLHRLHPDVYKDGNHKPEMALAMTDFEALGGFITLEELKAVNHNIPEVVDLIGDVNAVLVLQTSDQNDQEKVKPVLQAVFTHLMSASKEIVTDAVNSFFNLII
ncbi:unnamed protein product [Vicia faba]|uniref:Phosphomannose isomerase type I catalytic domain-containing protein n=1 Tax=Vicia faba TaxID=3906 RepID=A0AAV0ZKR5_VICFA|nr:unnamed protein product [Vicia faba]